MNLVEKLEGPRTAGLIDYVLPDGRVVEVAGATRATIPYQLADGRVVVAVRGGTLPARGAGS